MKRTVKKQFWFSKVEAQDLKKKAKKACLTEAALIRLLLRGYEPREKPDERFSSALILLVFLRNLLFPVTVLLYILKMHV